MDEYINYPDEQEPILCPDCGGTGCHPYLQAACRRCKGSGELTNAMDDRYKMARPRASSRCFESLSI